MKKIFLTALAATMIFVGCGKQKEEKKPVEKIKYVVTEPAEVRKMSQIFTTDAILVPEGKIDHKTEKGGTIKEILKKNGDTVKKGDIVMKLTDSKTESAYFSAKASYASAEAAYKIARNNYMKFKQLYEKDLISYLEYVNYENTYVNAKGSYESAKANYENAKNDYDKLFRKADINGVVGNLFGKEGNEVSADDVVFTVIDDSDMESYVGFPAEWLSQIHVGGPVEIEIPAVNKKVEGKILEINPIANDETKKYMIKIGMENKDEVVRDGMYAYAKVPVGEVEVLSTKDSAVFIRELISYVYKIENGVARRVEIKTGATNLPYTAILSDTIKKGDMIVVDGVFGLEEGDKVQEATESETKTEE
ncbi:efflux RND transporter periplasmic adaptor subunit [Fusobacterium sp.]|uniref:efflux RND transporter periplasmic adaptor subunit n=1 Tax=Fusobacterium sp. TaxID=68766 RepID=UPI0026279CD0|nr:efflux RND transporter periplasmic adaptor subunit [Fusobacterium sp.]